MMLKYLVIVLSFSWSFIALAFESSKVTITLENKSTKTFEYEKAKPENPGNEVSMDPEILKPGAKAIITGVITQDYDLYATITFKNQAQFTISDRRQSRGGFPVFSMKGRGVRSSVDEQIRNPKRGPSLLAFTAAFVSITDGN